MNDLVRLSLVTCIIGWLAVHLPTAFASGTYCGFCHPNELQPLQQCNTTTRMEWCVGKCFAATIELMNGTFIGVKDCFRGDNCTSSTACANITVQVTQGGPGISFKRCEASCCSKNLVFCNRYLPAFGSSSPTVPATSQTPATKAKDKDPTAAGINLKAVYYLSICLLAVIQIMS